MFITGLNMAYSLFDSLSSYCSKDQKAAEYLINELYYDKNGIKTIESTLSKTEMGELCNYYIQNKNDVDKIEFWEK